ncbi:MAG: hypothetical protein HYY13_04805 [Nitrospirae bacterium]|nr:hypothetical protein [Nitrospirota bacterium]
MTEPIAAPASAPEGGPAKLFLTRIFVGLALAACITGFYESLSTSWTPLYRLNIRLHPLLGGAAVIGALWWIVRGRRTPSHLAYPSAALVALALFSGILGVLGHPANRATPWFLAHAWLGIGCYATLAAFGVAWIRRARHGLSSIVPLAAWAAVCLAPPAILTAAGRTGPTSLAVEMKLSPLLKNFEENWRTPWPSQVAGLVGGSRACGASGCHAELLEDFRQSGHFLSPRSPYFQKNLDLLEAETGPGHDRICGACHFPVGVLRGRGHSELAEGETYSCAFCHSITDVTIGPDPARSAYLLDPNVNHLHLFADGESEPSEEARRLVRLNPRGHARVFSRPLYKTNEFCLACHHLQIRPPARQGQFVEPTCRDCHMQPRHLLGASGSRMNHLFPGSNTALPQSLGAEKTVRLLQDWLRGDLLTGFRDSFWELRDAAQAKPRRAFWLVMTFDASAPPEPGSTFALKVMTSNVGIGHNFPSAPLDLVEAWLQITATTTNGARFFERGIPDATGRLAEGTHRLGGYMLDAEGQRIERNRVWVTAKKVTERAIAQGQTVEDAFEIPVPADPGPFIQVEARWSYRKLNPDFTDWAYGDGNFHAPVSEVASAAHRFEVRAEEAR